VEGELGKKVTSTAQKEGREGKGDDAGIEGDHKPKATREEKAKAKEKRKKGGRLSKKKIPTNRAPVGFPS